MGGRYLLDIDFLASTSGGEHLIDDREQATVVGRILRRIIVRHWFNWTTRHIDQGSHADGDSPSTAFNRRSARR